MSPNYEAAARLLLFLTRAGLAVSADVDARAVVARLALLIDMRERQHRDLSHAATAVWILDDLVGRAFAVEPREARARLLAIIGTAVGNIESGEPRAGARRRGGRS